MRASVIDQTHPSNSIPSPSASISQQPFINENLIFMTRSLISNHWIDMFRKRSGGRIILFSSENDSQKTSKEPQEDSILVFDGITSLSVFFSPCEGKNLYSTIGIKSRRWKKNLGTLRKVQGIPIDQFPKAAILSSSVRALDAITAWFNKPSLCHDTQKHAICRQHACQASLTIPCRKEGRSL